MTQPRISLWMDIVKTSQRTEKIRAIEFFDPEELKIEQGDTKNSVVVDDVVCPTNAMAKLYMTVTVE